MSLAGIQNHLGLDTQVLERPIQPFGLTDGVGGIFLAIEDQRGGVRIADVCVRGVARVDIRVLPGRAEIPFVSGGRGCLPKRAKSSGFLWITHFAPAATL